MFIDRIYFGKDGKLMKNKVLLKRVGMIIAVIIGILICTIVVAFISLQARTKAILDDCSEIHNKKSMKRLFTLTVST